MMLSSSCCFELSILILFSIFFFPLVCLIFTLCIFMPQSPHPQAVSVWNIYLFIYLFTETGSAVLAPSVAKDDLEVLLLLCILRA